MNTCKLMRRMMLTASSEALHGMGDDPLARHIETCPACALIARRLLRRTEELDQVLDAGGLAPDVDAILAQATGAEASERVVAAEGRRSPRSRVRWRRWAPLAVAASAAALLILVRARSPGPQRSARVDRSEAMVAPSEAFPTVQSAPGHNVAVIRTDDPDLTVVWYF